jgi:CO/xanthine dehydrogenase Mo-binding subunit
VSVGSYRAPGVPQATFAVESHIDELARQLGLDPLELRLHNLAEEGDPTPNGGKWARVGLRECLERVRQHPLWRERREGDGNAGHRVGYGLAVGFWQGGLDTAAASCEVEPDGTIQLTVGSVDVSGSSTSFAQIAAEVLGVPFEKVRLVQVDSSQAPYAGGSMGSKITRTVGLAVVRAAEEARKQILAIASDQLEAGVDDLEIENGVVRVRGVPDRSATVGSLAKLTRGRTGYAPIFGSGGSAIKSVAPGSTVHLARVAVDEETGAVRVLDYAAVQDVGRAINPGEVGGQIQGGIAQGLGWALWERMAHDAEGQLLTASWLDYALPGAEGVPNVSIDLVEVPAKDGPFGAKGAGEPPIIPVSAAIANAIRSASGVRVTELPMNQERVAMALREALPPA